MTNGWDWSRLGESCRSAQKIDRLMLAAVDSRQKKQQLEELQCLFDGLSINAARTLHRDLGFAHQYQIGQRKDEMVQKVPKLAAEREMTNQWEDHSLTVTRSL